MAKKIAKNLSFSDPDDLYYMDIDFSPLNNRKWVTPQAQANSVAKGEAKESAPSDSMQKSLDFTLFKDSLNELMQMPEVRSEVVKVGKELVENDDFPSDEALEKIAWALLSPEDNIVDSEI